MSWVSDALRSQKNKIRESDSATPLGEYALMQPAERDAKSKWKDETLQEQPDSAENAERSRLIESRIVMPISAELRTLPVSESSSVVKGVDVFGDLPSLLVSTRPQDKLIILSNDDKSPAAESFKLLGVRLRNLQRQSSLKIVLVTSTIPGEGKSTVAVNLACTLALATNQKTLLLEGDLRRPFLSRMFDLEKHCGLSECLQDDIIVTKSIYNLERQKVWLLPAGRSRNNPLELLQSARLPVLMARLTAWYDWIIIDSPPVLPLADTSVWMRLSDGILLVTRQGTTRKRLLQRGIVAIEPNKLIGAILNASINSDHNYYYNYSYSSSRKSNNMQKQI